MLSNSNIPKHAIMAMLNGDTKKIRNVVTTVTTIAVFPMRCLNRCAAIRSSILCIVFSQFSFCLSSKLESLIVIEAKQKKEMAYPLY